EEKKIKYYFTIPPAKEHVYPKLMSQGLQCETQFSRLDQLYNYIKDDTLIRMIDYRKELIEGKNTRVTYMEADSHWNRFGAYLAYYKIMSRISKDFPQLKPENITEYKIDSSLGYGGDLQCHLGFDDMYTSHYYFFTLKSGDKPVIADSTNIVDPKLPCVVRELPDKGKGLKLFVVHDSFTGALIDFLSPRFDRSVFTWVKTPPVPAILKEKPDILIHEVTERFLSSVLNLPAEIRDDKGFLSEYFPSYYQNSSRK
ncbi:MAG TPA: hypothetical protein VK783_08450, partial [Bacteroidia bacterium]|nr:hypothetical protein [Bacteroidia bacterium]